MFDSPTSVEETFRPYKIAATILGVPAAWLKTEIEAGRVPHLRAGRRLLVNPETVERVLLDRASSATQQTEVANAVA